MGLYVNSTDSQGQALWNVERKEAWRPGLAWITTEGQELTPFQVPSTPALAGLGG